MTIMLPRSATPDPLRFPLVRLLDAALAENALLRNQLGAVIDAMVAEQMVVPRNRAEHPFTDSELAEIEAYFRAHWASIALNATRDM